MKPFVFKQFAVRQNKDVFRVGTDAVLLGSLASCKFARTALEVGTGGGVISLMLAQRNKTLDITAIDIDKNAVVLAAENFKNAPFSARLNVLHQDFKNFPPEAKFDLIFSNPPYFDVHTSQKDRLARQKIELNFEILTENASKLLQPEGIFSVIIPSNETDSFITVCKNAGLMLFRKVNVRGIETGPVKRHVLEFSHCQNRFKEEDVTLEALPRIYSAQYRELTKDFHPHF